MEDIIFGLDHLNESDPRTSAWMRARFFPSYWQRGGGIRKIVLTDLLVFYQCHFVLVNILLVSDIF